MVNGAAATAIFITEVEHVQTARDLKVPRIESADFLCVSTRAFQARALARLRYSAKRLHRGSLGLSSRD